MSIENPRQRRQRIEAVQETPGTIYERMSKAMNQPSDTSEQQLANQILDAQLTEHTFENKVANLQRELTEAREAFRTAADSLVNVSAERDSAVAEVVQWKNRDTYRENLITELRNERDRFRAAQQQAEKERDDIRSRMDGLFGTLKSVQSQRSEAEATIAELRAQLLTAEAQAAELRKALEGIRDQSPAAFLSMDDNDTFVFFAKETAIAALASTAASPLLERLRAAEALVKQAKNAFDDIPACMLPHDASCDGLKCTCWQASRVRFIHAAMTSTQNAELKGGDQ